MRRPPFGLGTVDPRSTPFHIFVRPFVIAPRQLATRWQDSSRRWLKTVRRMLLWLPPSKSNSGPVNHCCSQGAVAMRLSHVSVLLALLALIAGGPAASAQERFGGLTGVITDTSRAPIPGVMV